MSIVSEVSRLKIAKGSVKNSIINKGVFVPNEARVSEYSGYIDQIKTGTSEGHELCDIFKNVQISQIPATLQPTSLSMASFTLPDGSALVTSGATNSGLWLMRDGILTQLWMTGKNWNSFQLIEGYCLVVSTDTRGLLVYDLSTGTITNAYDRALPASTVFLPGPTGCLIGGGNVPLMFFDYASASVQTTGGSSARILVPLTQGALCFYGMMGVYYFNWTTKAYTSVYTTGSTWYYYKLVPDGCLIGDFSTSAGILRVKESTLSANLAWAINASWRNFLDIDGGCAIGCPASSTQPMLFYDYATETIKSTTGGYINMIPLVAIPGGCIVAVNQYIGVYKTATNAVSGIVTGPSGAGYSTAKELPDGEYLIGGATATTGLYLYRIADGSLTRLSAQGGYTVFVLTPTGCLTSGTASSTPLVFYVFGSGTLKNIGYPATPYMQIIEGGDALLGGIDNSTIYGLAYWNDATQTRTPLWYKGNEGAIAAKFRKLGSDWLIGGTGTNINSNLIFRSKQKDAIKLDTLINALFNQSAVNSGNSAAYQYYVSKEVL